MTTQQNLPKIIKCQNFKTDKMTFSEFNTKNQRNVSQMICFPYYDNTDTTFNLIFKTDPIKITQYGIPKIGPKTADFIKSDQDREYIKIPYDVSQPNSVELFKMLESIDKYMPTIQDKIFGTKSKQYKYSPIINEPREEEDDDQKSKDKMKYVKIKFDTDFNNDRQISTSIFINNEFGKPVHVKNIKTVSDVAEHVTWNGTIRLIIIVNKLWAAKTAKKKDDLKEYSLSLKALQIVVTEKSSNPSSIKNALKNSFAFGEIDEKK